MAQHTPAIPQDVLNKVLLEVQAVKDQQAQLAANQPPAHPGSFMEPTQRGLGDVLRNPSQAQRDALVAGLIGAMNPNSNSPIASGLVSGLSALQQRRASDYAAKVSSFKQQNDALKARLDALGSEASIAGTLGNLGVSQENLNLSKERFGFEQAKTISGRTQFNASIPGQGTMAVQRDEFGHFYDINNQPVQLPHGTRLESTGKTPTDIAGFDIPSGFMLADPTDPSKGVRPIPGGPKATLTPEQAAKAQLVTGAIENQDVIDRMLFSEDGSVDRTNVFSSTFRLPFTEGRSMNVLIKDSIEAKIRAESGAAVPETEVARAAQRFVPSPVDSDETIKIKRALLRQFLRGTYDKFDPTGAYKRTESIDSLLRDSEKFFKSPENVRVINGIPVLIEE